MTPDRLSPNTRFQRWAAALMVLLAVPLAIGFSARLATIRQMRQDEARLQREVEQEQAQQSDLTSLRAYVASDAYVEHWARVEARMARPGEVAVVPVAPSAPQPRPPDVAPLTAPRSILDEWWAVFFDEPPTP